MDRSDQTVFVVNDNRTVLDSLRALLESAGLSVETFSSGQAFLKAYESDRSACLVLDCDLSDGGSLDFLGHWSARGVNIPTILIGWCGDATATTRAASAGVAAVLEKPFEDQLLLDAIERAFNRRTDR